MTHIPKNFVQYFEATLEMLPQILDWVQQTLSYAGLPKKDAQQFELALEEAVVNVVMHAYSQMGGRLEIQALLTPELIAFTLIDEGVAYDPLSAPVKPEMPIEEMVEGGLGVKLMRTYCDGLSYERVGQHNVLVLSKKITG
jgi:serine/threonine-protein kinase RsbW